MEFHAKHNDAAVVFFCTATEGRGRGGGGKRRFDFRWGIFIELEETKEWQLWQSFKPLRKSSVIF